MSNSGSVPAFAGKSNEVRYEGLTAINACSDDGVHIRYEIAEGAYAGAKGECNTCGDCPAYRQLS